MFTRTAPARFVLFFSFLSTAALISLHRSAAVEAATYSLNLMTPEMRQFFGNLKIRPFDGNEDLMGSAGVRERKSSNNLRNLMRIGKRAASPMDDSGMEAGIAGAADDYVLPLHFGSSLRAPNGRLYSSKSFRQYRPQYIWI